jgi:hypothetical protein
MVCRETQAALDLWTDLRLNVSTPSTFLDREVLQHMAACSGLKRKRTSSSEESGLEDVLCHQEVTLEEMCTASVF